MFRNPSAEGRIIVQPEAGLVDAGSLAEQGSLVGGLAKLPFMKPVAVMRDRGRTRSVVLGDTQKP